MGAAARYRDAYREYPRPDLMCNVGVAYYKAKDLPRSHRYLDQCLTAGTALDPDFIASVRNVLAAVEQKLATADYKPLSFVVQPQSSTTTFAAGVHDEPLVGPRQVWVPFGSYRVTIHAEGYADRILDIPATSRERAEYNIKLEPAAAVVAPPPDRQITALPPPPPPAAGPSYFAPIVASAATGVLGGLALGVYVTARGQAETAADANAVGDARAYDAAADTARKRQYISWGIGAAAGAAAIVSGILWYRAATSSARVEVTATASSGGVTVVGSW